MSDEGTAAHMIVGKRDREERDGPSGQLGTIETRCSESSGPSFLAA